MAKVYDKSGKEYDVPHAVDLKGWIDAGYTTEPKGAKSGAKKSNKVTEVIKDVLNIDDDKND